MNPEAARADMERLLAAYETEPNHTLHATRLACRLFDELRHRHGLGAEDRLLLEIAGALHDIGWSCTQPDGKAHHKVSAKMVRNFPWESLGSREKEIIAMVARYHRKSLPSADHADFMALPFADQERVQWLGAFLRIGDGLDRRHIQRVQEVEVRDLGNSCQILVYSPNEAEAELAGARKKADLLERLLQCKVEFVHLVSNI